MKWNAEFFTTTTGQWVLLGIALMIGGSVVVWQHQHRQLAPMSAAKVTAPAMLPRIFTRSGARFPEVKAPAATATKEAESQKPVAGMPARPRTPSAAPVSPLGLFAAAVVTEKPRLPSAPYGRMIPCETVVTLESNRLETPVVGLVTEDVWDHGRLVIPAGAEVHGRAALDRSRERLAVSGAWVVVWRTADRDIELSVQGLALDREQEDGRFGDHDGSAGLRGTVVRTQDDRELRLFAATFLGAATTALQDTRPTVGLLGESSLPAATARNATLAGFAAILREEAQQIRDAIARDGFYLRVPSGKPFYLYVTQTLELAQARQTPASTTP